MVGVLRFMIGYAVRGTSMPATGVPSCGGGGISISFRSQEPLPEDASSLLVLVDGWLYAFHTQTATPGRAYYILILPHTTQV